MLATTVLRNTHRFTTWSDVFNIPFELRLQVTVKPYCPYMFFFSTIKTRNSTIRFFFFGTPHTTRRSHAFSTHTKKFKLLRRSCKCVGVVFIILRTRKGPEGHTFSLIENKSSWPHVPRGTLFLIRCSVRIMLYYMIYPCGRCPFFTTPPVALYI